MTIQRFGIQQHVDGVSNRAFRPSQLTHRPS